MSKVTVKKEFEPRKYVCSRWPFLRLRKGIKFDRGVYVAGTQEMADIVEENEQFGGLIRRVFEKPTEEQAEGATAIEQQIMASIKKKVPQVRKGAISSTTMVG